MEMQNGMLPGGNMNTMQRPQPGNAAQQIHAKIMQDLRNSLSQLPVGWQTTFDIGQRAGRIMQLFSVLRCLNAEIPKCLQIAQSFESRTIMESPSKEVYSERMARKMADVTQKRHAQAAMMEQNNMTAMQMNNNNNMMGMPQQQNLAMGGGMGMGNNMGMFMNMNMNMQNQNQNMNPNMNMNNMNTMGNAAINLPNAALGMPVNPTAGNMSQQNRAFPNQLQRQMQPSSVQQQQQLQLQQLQQLQNQQQLQLQQLQQLPIQQQQQQQQLQNQAQQQQQQQQPQPQQHPPAQQRQPQAPPPAQNAAMMDQTALQNAQSAQPLVNQNTGVPQNPGQPGQPSSGMVFQHARRMYNSLTDEKRNLLRNNIISSLQEPQRSGFINGGNDALFKFFLNKARDALMKQQQARTGPNPDQQGQGGELQMAGNTGMQSSTNNSNGMQQPPGGPGQQQGSGQGFDLAHFAGQQANALKSQESGEQVVPASVNANNSINFGGQVAGGNNIGMNGQPATNQRNQVANGNQQILNPMQFLQMQQQQQKQRQEQTQQRNQQGQPQPQQQPQPQGIGQQNQLHGQPGGLNAPNALNGGQVNSPAMNMSMLNRPMVPPGQAGPVPAAQQQNRPPGAMPTPAIGANQLAQHYQTMVQQNQQGIPSGLPGLSDQERALLMSMAPPMRERLATVPPEQLRQFLARYAMQRNNILNGTAPNGQPGGAAPAVPPNINVGALTANNLQQQAMMGGMPPRIGGAVPPPGMSQQQNQQQQQPQTLEQSAVLQQRLQQHQQSQMRQRAMDLRPFPKPVLGRLGIQSPDHVQEWGKLKQYIEANQATMPADALQKVQMAQVQWFNAHPEEMQAAIEQLRQQLQNMTGQPQLANVGAPTMPNGQNAVMNANLAATNRPNMAGNMHGITISAQEIQQLRERLPAFQHMPDDQLRELLVRRRAQQNAPGMPQNQAMNNLQALQNIGQPGVMPQQRQRPPPQQAGVEKPPAALHAQSLKRPSVVNDDIMEIPNPNASQAAAPQVPNMQLNAMQQQQLQAQAQAQAQGMQRAPFPTPEEIAKMPPQQRRELQAKIQQMRDAALRKVQMNLPNAQQPAVPPQAMQQQQPQQQQVPQRAQPQPPQPQKGTSLAMGPPTQQERERMIALSQEVISTTPKGPAVQLDSNGVKHAQAMLKKLWNPALNVDKTYLAVMRLKGLGEERVKEAMRAKIIIQQNAADPMGNIKEYLSVTPQELRRLEQFLATYFTQLKSYNEELKAKRQEQAAAVTQVQQPPPKPATADPPKPQKAQTTARQTAQGRKASTSQKVPPAPTEDKAFVWGATSPHGVPKYDPSRNGLTADKLKPPPAKKRRTQTGDSQATPPAASPTAPAPSTTPSMSSTAKPSPEQNRKPPQATKLEQQQQQQQNLQLQKLQLQQQQQQHQQQLLQKEAAEKHKFRCQELFCDASIQGFETEELLKQHVEAEHKPIEDPLKFLFESAASALGVDIDGKPLPAAAAQKDTKTSLQTKPKSAFPVRGSTKTEGLTPKVKAESGTPATPSSTGKPKPGATPMIRKHSELKSGEAVTTKGEASNKEPTLLEDMAEKLGLDLPADADKPTPSDPNASFSTEEWSAIFDDVFSNPIATTKATDTFLTDWTQLSRVNDWTSLNETFSPSSSDLTPTSSSSSMSNLSSQSSRDSDIAHLDLLRINFEWDPFNDGDTGVPENLLQGLGLGDSPALAPKAADGDQDTAMPDAAETSGKESDPANDSERVVAPSAAPAAEGENTDAAKPKADVWDWSGDLADWDVLVGADAGLGDGSSAWGWSEGLGAVS